MTALREYAITLYKYEDLDSFYEDMETPGGNLYIPDRKVDVSERHPTERSTLYMLTEEESEQIRQDPRVEWIELSARERGLIVVPYDYIGKPWTYSAVKSRRVRQWGLVRTAARSSIADKISYATSTAPSKDAVATISLPPNWKSNYGEDIDVVICDTTIHVAGPSVHTELQGRTVDYDWYGLHGAQIGDTKNQNTRYLYNDPDVHGTHVASTVAGATQGWASKATIYNISPFGGRHATLQNFSYIREFHLSKPINPKYGTRNPTIVNCSWGFVPQLISTGLERWVARDSDLFLNTQIPQIQSVTRRGVVHTGVSAGVFTIRQLLQLGVGITATNNTTQWWVNAGNNRDFSIDAAIRDLAAIPGIVIVAAAGNYYNYVDVPGGIDFDNIITYNQGFTTGFYNRPGSVAGSRSHLNIDDDLAVISVGAYDVDDTCADFSTRGPRNDIWAPGVSVLGALFNTQSLPNFHLSRLQGTSMASPQVAGLVALYAEFIRKNDNGRIITQTDVRNQIRSGGLSVDGTLKPNRLFGPAVEGPNRALALPGAEVAWGGVSEVTPGEEIIVIAGDSVSGYGGLSLDNRTLVDPTKDSSYIAAQDWSITSIIKKLYPDAKVTNLSRGGMTIAEAFTAVKQGNLPTDLPNPYGLFRTLPDYLRQVNVSKLILRLGLADAVLSGSNYTTALMMLYYRTILLIAADLNIDVTIIGINPAIPDGMSANAGYFPNAYTNAMETTANELNNLIIAEAQQRNLKFVNLRGEISLFSLTPLSSPDGIHPYRNLGNKIGRAIYKKLLFYINPAIQPNYNIVNNFSPLTRQEGQSATFNFTATNIAIPNGTTMYWAAATDTGARPEDVASPYPPLGSFVVQNNTGTITLTVANDSIRPETKESFYIDVYATEEERNALLDPIASSAPIEIIDMAPVTGTTTSTTSTTSTTTLSGVNPPPPLPITSSTTTTTTAAKTPNIVVDISNSFEPFLYNPNWPTPTSTTSSREYYDLNFNVASAEVFYIDAKPNVKKTIFANINFRASSTASLSSLLNNKTITVTLLVKTTKSFTATFKIDNQTVVFDSVSGASHLGFYTNSIQHRVITFTKESGVLRAIALKDDYYPSTSYKDQVTKLLKTLPPFIPSSTLFTQSFDIIEESAVETSATTSAVKAPKTFNPTLTPTSAFVDKGFILGLRGGPTSSSTGAYVSAVIRQKANVDRFFGLSYKADTWVSLSGKPGQTSSLLNGALSTAVRYPLTGQVTYEITYREDRRYLINGGLVKTFTIPVTVDPAKTKKYEMIVDWHEKKPGQSITLLCTTNDPTGNYKIRVSSVSPHRWQEIFANDSTFNKFGEKVISTQEFATGSFKIKLNISSSYNKFTSSTNDLLFNLIRNSAVVAGMQVKIIAPTSQEPGPQNFEYLLTVDKYAKTYGEPLGIMFYTRDTTPDQRFRIRHTQEDMTNGNALPNVINTGALPLFRVYNAAGTGSSADNLDDPPGVKIIALPTTNVTAAAELTIFVDKVNADGTFTTVASTAPVYMSAPSAGILPNEIIQVDSKSKTIGNPFYFFVSTTELEPTDTATLVLNSPFAAEKVFVEDSVNLKRANQTSSLIRFKRQIIRANTRTVTKLINTEVSVRLERPVYGSKTMDTDVTGALPIEFSPIAVTPTYTYKMYPLKRVHDQGEAIVYVIKTTEPDGTTLSWSINTAFSVSSVGFNGNIFTDNQASGSGVVRLGTVLIEKTFSANAASGTTIAFDVNKGTQRVLSPTVTNNKSLPAVCHKNQYWVDVIGSQSVQTLPVVIFGDSVSTSGGLQLIDGRDATNILSYATSNQYGDIVTALKAFYQSDFVYNRSGAGITVADAVNGPAPGKVNPFNAFSGMRYLDSNPVKVLVIRYGIDDAFTQSRIDSAPFNGDAQAAATASIALIDQLVNYALIKVEKVILIGPNPTSPAKPHASMGPVVTSYTSAYYAKADVMLNAINTHMAGLPATNSSISFINVRSLVAANGGIPAGGLVDGIQPTAEFGGKINSLIARELGKTHVAEGGEIKFSVWTSSLPPSANIGYTITGVSAVDFIGSPQLTGNITIPSLTLNPPHFSVAMTAGGWNKEYVRTLGTDVIECYTRGNEIIVSENPHYNSSAPIGTELQRLVTTAKGLGYRVGIAISPYATISVNGSLPVSQTLVDSTVQTSGADFVLLTPFFVGMNEASFGILWNWVQTAINKYRGGVYNKIVKIAVQGWFNAGQNTRDNLGDYVKNLLTLSNVEEFILFKKNAFDDIRLDSNLAEYLGHSGTSPNFTSYSLAPFYSNQLLKAESQLYRTVSEDNDLANEVMNFKLANLVSSKLTTVLLPNTFVNQQANVTIVERDPVITNFTVTPMSVIEGNVVNFSFTVQDTAARQLLVKITPVTPMTLADISGTNQWTLNTRAGFINPALQFTTVSNDGADPVESYYIDIELLQGPSNKLLRRFGTYYISEPVGSTTTSTTTTTVAPSSPVDFTLSYECWAALGVANITVTGFSGSTSGVYEISYPFKQGFTPLTYKRVQTGATEVLSDYPNDTWFVKVCDANICTTKSIVTNCIPFVEPPITFTLTSLCNPPAIEVSNLAGGNEQRYVISYPYSAGLAPIDFSTVNKQQVVKLSLAPGLGALTDGIWSVRVAKSNDPTVFTSNSVTIACQTTTTTTTAAPTTTTTAAPTTTTTAAPTTTTTTAAPTTTTTTAAPTTTTTTTAAPTTTTTTAAPTTTTTTAAPTTTTTTTAAPTTTTTTTAALIDYTVTVECNPINNLANIIISNPTGGVGTYRTYQPELDLHEWRFLGQISVFPAKYPNLENGYWATRVYDNENNFREKYVTINCISPTTTTTTTTAAPTTTTTTTVALIDFTVTVTCDPNGSGNITISNPTGGVGTYRTYDPVAHLVNFTFTGQTSVFPSSFTNIANGYWAVRVYDAESNFREKFVTVSCAGTTTTTTAAPTTTTTTTVQFTYTLITQGNTIYQPNGNLNFQLVTNDNRVGTWDFRADDPEYLNFGTIVQNLNSGNFFFNLGVSGTRVPDDALTTTLYLDRIVGGVTTFGVATFTLNIIYV